MERTTYDISSDHGLFTSKVYEHGRHTECAQMPYEKLNVRIERQTLRRLPKSGAIIFTNNPIFDSFEEMKDEPMIPSIIKKHLEEGSEKILIYKNFDKIKDQVLAHVKRLDQ